MPVPQPVVHFVDSDTYGGCEEVVLMLLAGLDRDRWQPTLFHHDAADQSRLLEEARRLGIRCRLVPRITRHNLLPAMRQFIQELRTVAPAIFHVHLNWPLACRHEILAAKLGGVRAIIATSHLYSPICGVRAWMKQRLQAAMIDRYIAVSNEIKTRLTQDLRVPAAKVQVVHNGVRLTRFDQSANSSLRSMLTAGNERPIVFTAARLHSQKGHIYLLEAAGLVPDALFVLAGDGPERKRLEEHALRLGLEGRVRFLGHRSDVPQLLANCDVFVLPSLYEGLPLTVLEAMAAGKPVVATAIGGTDEAVTHEVTGLLVPPANPTALAAGIRAVLSDKGLAARLAKSGRAVALQEFSSEAMAQGVSAVYSQFARV